MQFLIKPWAHQLEAIEAAGVTPNCRFSDMALFFEMGTGKTGTMINVLRKHFTYRKRIARTLILGPVIVVRNWAREFGVHSKIPQGTIIQLTGSQKKRIKDFHKAVTDPRYQTLTEGRIIITNYEAMEMDDLLAEIHRWRPEILICDESQRLKNHQSARAQKVVEFADRADHRYILTGSPILNSAMDIFNQYRILDSGETFGKNFYEFRGRFFQDVNAGMPSNVHFPLWAPRPETYEQLNRLIYKKAIRKLKIECLDLPPLVKQIIPVEMGVEQARIYSDMRKDYLAWVKEHDGSPEPRAVVAQMALTKALRLQQIVSGYVKTEDGKEIEIKDNPRLKALKQLLEDLTPEHKVIVWATFRNNYAAIAAVCKLLKIGFVELHGGITTAEKNKAIEQFQTDRKCRVIIANQKAGGIGVNLVEQANIVNKGQCSYSIFYSKNYSLDDDLQAESRNHRGGAEVYDKVTRIDLVAPGTIDELILEALAKKQNIADQVLDWKI